MELTARHTPGLHKKLTVTAVLILLWLIATVVIGYFARQVNQMTFIGFPLAFYIGAHGALLLYVGMVFFYAYRMNRPSREYDVHQVGDQGTRAKREGRRRGNSAGYPNSAANVGAQAGGIPN